MNNNSRSLRLLILIRWLNTQGRAIYGVQLEDDPLGSRSPLLLPPIELFSLTAGRAPAFLEVPGHRSSGVGRRRRGGGGVGGSGRVEPTYGRSQCKYGSRCVVVFEVRRIPVRTGHE